MNKQIYSAFITVLALSVLAAGATIFNDNFETGDTSAWTSNTVESGNTLAITSAAAFEGAYGMSVTTGTSNDDARVNKQITGTSDIYTRVMLKLNDNIGNGNHKHLMVAAGSSESSPMGIFGIRTKANYVNRAFTWAAGSWASASNFDFDTNKWYCVETQFVRSPTNGAIRVWIDGVQVANRQGLNTGSTNPTYLRLGSDGSTVSSNFYMDDFKSDTTRIGCASEPIDIVISNLTYYEYDLVGNNTIYVNVTATITNTGEATTNLFTSRLSGIFGNTYKTTTLGPQESTTINKNYLCQYNHTASTYADIYQNVTETNENNNYAETYIDCII